MTVIREYEAARRWPTTFSIAAEVYRIEPDANGNRWVSDAQHDCAHRRARNGCQTTISTSVRWRSQYEALRKPRDMAHRSKVSLRASEFAAVDAPRTNESTGFARALSDPDANW